MKMKNGLRLFWIALNRHSCARFPMALRWPFTVSPIPQMLIGFPTGKEAVNAQQLCLYAPMPEVETAMKRWIERPDICVYRPMNPEPMTEGETLWLELDEEDIAKWKAETN